MRTSPAIHFPRFRTAGGLGRRPPCDPPISHGSRRSPRHGQMKTSHPCRADRRSPHLSTFLGGCVREPARQNSANSCRWLTACHRYPESILLHRASQIVHVLPGSGPFSAPGPVVSGCVREKPRRGLQQCHGHVPSQTRWEDGLSSFLPGNQATAVSGRRAAGATTSGSNSSATPHSRGRHPTRRASVWSSRRTTVAFLITW